MKKSIIVAILVWVSIFLIPAGPTRSQGEKTTSKDLIMEGLKVLQGFQGGQQARPDLTIEKIWLDDVCQINVRLKNIGSGIIPDAEYETAVMRIVFGKQFKEFPYVNVSATGQPPVDAGEILKAPGGVVEFNTGIVIDGVQSVSVFADARRNIKEANEDNNTKTQQLNPQCFQQAPTAVPAAPASPLAKPEPVPAAQSTAGSTMPMPGTGQNIAGTGTQIAPTAITLTTATSISGQWKSSVGLIYSITQEQNYFQWTVMNSSETGSGTVNGSDVSASWQGPLGSGSSQGKIVEVDAGGKAAKISWENGVQFHR